MTNIVIGTFFGDEAKGQCVNNLCNSDSIVVRFSGANQVGHNVKHNDITHCFRNFGSGTLKNVPTYWSKYCICDLFTLAQETLELKQLGIVPRIIFSPFCELVTPFDVIKQWNNSANRFHGTVGTGFKSTLDRVKSGYSLTIVDALNYQILKEKLYNIQKYYYKFEENSISTSLEGWIESVHTISKFIEIADIDFLKGYSNIIFEGSQGILLDQKHGVMPFCTPSNTTSKNAIDIISKLNIDMRDIMVNYVCRPYITRHGNGPLLTATPIINIDDSNNPWNDFQKSFRACKFDICLLEHSLRIDNIYSKNCNHRLIFSHANELSDDLLNLIQTKLNIPILKFEFETWID